MPALHPRVHAAAQVTAQFELMDEPPAPRWMLTVLNGILIAAGTYPSPPPAAAKRASLSI